MTDSRPIVAVYPIGYLTVSMTFVHRQLMGVSPWFRAIVLADEVQNRDLFPFDPIYQHRRGRIESRLTAAASRLFGRFASLAPSQWISFGRVLRRERPALIHAHFGPAGLEMLPLARALRIPLVVTFHGYDASMLLRDERYCRDLRRLFQYAHVVAVSNRMRERLLGLGADPQRTRTHYIGAPVEEFALVDREAIAAKRLAGERIRLLQVSNFVEKKGHRYTLEAFRQVLERHPKCELTLAGDGPLRPEIERQARSLGVQEHVFFVGKVSKERVIPLMAESDLFLHHSVTGLNGDEEGIPTVLMEAMATGLPVVSTRHAGIPELVESGVTGVLVAERDVLAYASAICELLEGVQPEMGHRAAAFVRKHFDLERQNAELAKLYRWVVAQRSE